MGSPEGGEPGFSDDLSHWVQSGKGVRSLGEAGVIKHFMGFPAAKQRDCESDLFIQ